MNEADIMALWPQIRTELVVFLGRPTVQLQLLAAAIALIAAAVLGRTLRNRWQIRNQNWAQESNFVKKLVNQLFIQLATGILALAFIQLAKLVLTRQGARTALVDSILGIVILYLVLKATLALAHTVGKTEAIQRYRLTLIIPLFIIILGQQVFRIFFRGDRLGNAPVFTLFDNTVTLSVLFLITAGFYLWVVGVHALGQGVHFLATRYGGADDGSTQATLTLIRYLLIILGLGYVLYNLNFNTTTIAAISGGLSVGVGFALSTILSNFVSGILLLFERTLHPGDVIEFNGELSIVEKITIRSIRVRTFDNVEKIIPNSDFVTSPFTTYTGKSPKIRIKLLVGVSYHDPYQHVMETLLNVAKNNVSVLQSPPPEVRIENFGDFTVDYQLYVWIANPIIRGIIKNELNQAILEAFSEEGITIPFPLIEVAQVGSQEEDS